MTHPVTEQVAKIYLNDAFGDGFHNADVLVLGCTHYPLIKPLLPYRAGHCQRRRFSALHRARLVQKIRDLHGNVPSEPQSPSLCFFATDLVRSSAGLVPNFLGHPINSVEHVDLKE